MELTVVPFDHNSNIINLYPNPNNGHFAIDLGSGLDLNSRITIINLSGKTIYNDMLKEQESSREFDLSNAAPGTYILMVTNGNTIVTTEKFILK